MNFRMQSMFFDRAAVTGRVSLATRKVLSKFGAFVRTRSRSSIRKRKKPSAPGQPPSSHTGLLKKFIYFAYEPTRQNVVIGPERLDAKLGDAPEALEHGGTTQIVEFAGGKRRTRAITIKARSFMGPAFEEEKKTLPALWANSVR